jgi:hypothetical protein
VARLLAGGVAVVACLVPVLLAGSRAEAHSDDGVMTVTRTEQVGADQVRLEVGIVYANDQEPAEDATVTATLTGPAGEVVGPIELPRTTGALYGAQVQVPVLGNWSVAVGSTTPAAEATAAFEVISQSSPAPPPEPPPATDVLAAEAAVSSSDDSDDGALWLWVVVGLLVVLVAASAVVVIKRRGG